MAIVSKVNHNIIHILSNAETMAIAMVEDFVKRSTDVVSSKGQFSVVLSGGNTPKIFFDTLSKKEFLGKIFIFSLVMNVMYHPITLPAIIIWPIIIYFQKSLFQPAIYIVFR
jgi:hypothetical protein